jgi:hypothetical protein
LSLCTATVNGTWLSRAELQILPDTKRFGIAGEFIPPGFTLTGSLPMESSKFPFHPHAQRNAFRRDARPQSRLFAPPNQSLKHSEL